MKIQININEEKEFEILCKLQKTIYNMLLKFSLMCPEKYNSVLKPLEKTPICLSINYRFSNTYACVKWIGTRKIKEIRIEFDHNVFTYNNKQLKLIIAHELGHVIDLFYRGGNCPDHDEVWKDIATLFGAERASYIIHNI
jgi:predicted SprT family Zn-dependent metalloprotease